jgi:diguanylate cyclase (GGDEF)-like protein
MSFSADSLNCIGPEHLTLAHLGCWSLDIRNAAVVLSPTACVLLGLQAESGQGLTVDRDAILERIHPGDRERIATAWRACLAGEHFDEEYRLDSPSPTWIWEKIHVEFDANSQLRNGSGILQDVSRHRQPISDSLIRASHDVLTGLPNRALLAEHLDLALPLARRNNSGAAVLFIDLDRFKQVNDVLGHAMGDELLRQVAGRMRDCLRESDMVARQGGDEFIVVLQEIAIECDAGLVALKLIEALTRPFDLHGTAAHIGASIGIALFPADGDDADALFRNADLALYQAKTNGRETLRFFDPAMRETALRQHSLEMELRLALANQEFILEYQPIFDITSGQLHAVEALIRWHHPDRGLIAPDQFIPAAEENGLIRDIGRWVIQEVFHQMACWRKEGIDFKVSVNLSSRQIPEGLRLDWLREQIDEYGIDPEQLVFEITEGVLLKDTPATQRWIDGVLQLGIRLALDDFGTGYASLGFLRNFRMHQLKIDRSFIVASHGEPRHLGLVKSIIDIANNLGLEVTAEGVEDAETLIALSGMGCHYAQGFHLAHPMPVTAISAMLTDSGFQPGPLTTNHAPGSAQSVFFEPEALGAVPPAPTFSMR